MKVAVCPLFSLGFLWVELTVTPFLNQIMAKNLKGNDPIGRGHFSLNHDYGRIWVTL